MKFSMIVYSPPSRQTDSQTPLLFAQTLLNQGHELYRVFFYGDGVYNGASSPFSSSLERSGSTSGTAASETTASDQWAALADSHNVDLVVCITAALERGVAIETELETLTADNQKQRKTEITGIRDGFQISGLGQMVDAIANSDRTITFR